FPYPSCLVDRTGALSVFLRQHRRNFDCQSLVTDSIFVQSLRRPTRSGNSGLRPKIVWIWILVQRIVNPGHTAFASQRSRMGWSLDYDRKRPARPGRLATVVAFAAIFLASCASEKAESKGAADRGVPAVSVVVDRVVQKTVPLFTELTARTDATDSV